MDVNKENGIDFLNIGKKLWSNKIFVIKCSIVGCILGIILAFSIPKEYTTTVVLMPEVQTGGTASMSSLASLAGINLNSTNVDILASPDLYPDIFKSTTFLRGLFDINVQYVEDNTDTTLYSYIQNQRKPWWSTITQIIFSLFKLSSEEANNSNNTNNTRFISKDDLIIMEDIKDRIAVSSEKKTGITTIEVTMQNPEISGYIADTLTSYFQSYIINYRTKKARIDLNYAEQLYDEAKSNYYESQQKLASFMDRNKSVISAQYKTNQERLQNEVNLSYSIYNQSAQQLQLARVKVQNTTPVFTIIQPAIQPIKASKPSKLMIIMSMLLLSFTIASFWILKKDILLMLR